MLLSLQSSFTPLCTIVIIYSTKYRSQCLCTKSSEKMEVLPAQNQFQGQFGVIGSNKFKDWSSALTPPRSNDRVSTTPKRNLRTSSISHPSTNLGLPFITSSQTSPSAVIENVEKSVPGLVSSSLILGPEDDSINLLSDRLQEELRAAKSRHLACTEVLLPADLLHRVAGEMIKASEKEPCGIRGCSVYIEFEDEQSNSRRIACLKVDRNTVSTFELYLTLKQDRSGWTSLLPQFLKNLARSSTVMISPEFALTKNKLYNSFSD